MQKICIVVPCYNEAQRLRFDAFAAYLKEESAVDFLFCNDGSTDNTLSLLHNFEKIHPGRVWVLNMEKNGGKAEAVRNGVLHACRKDQYAYVGFWDADLATPLAEIAHFVRSLEGTGKTVALGSRWKRLGARIERKGTRHLLGRVFSTFASILLKMPVYDTQCGAKIFRSDLAFLFEEKFITSWLFDIEILARYRNKKGLDTALATLIEVPVNAWQEVGGSKLKLKHMIKVPLELLSIHSKYN